ncbi:MAG: putative bifunctional diguanylate cyclase/phosphodiesterase [Halanaerobiaceae bacterium]
MVLNYRERLDKYLSIEGQENMLLDRQKSLHESYKYICIVIYLLLVYLMGIFNNPETSIIPEVIYKGGNLFQGITSQIHVMIAVYLVANNIKKGFIYAWFLTILGFLGTLYGVLIVNNFNAIIGVTVYLGAFVIITIINRYKAKFNKQLEVVSDHKKQLEYLAFYDTLTEIPNRNKILQQLNYLTELPAEKKIKFSFVFIDLVNFKKINDLMGNQAGDAILKMLVERWQPLVHKKDMLGRIDGDDFALIIERELKKQEIVEYISKFKDVLKNKFILNNKDLYISANFGIALYPDDGEDTDSIFKSADIATHSFENTTTESIHFFDRNMKREILQKIKLENALKKVVQNNELHLEYQPQYAYDSYDKIRGFEALLRWYSPEFGYVSPTEFIPIAEDMGIIHEIGEWVLRNALKRFINITEKYDVDYVLSINISVKQLLEPDFINMVKKIIAETGFDTQYLEFEITESVFIVYPEYITKVLYQIRKMGISIALDDFGTGYAALSYLLNISIDILKIDKIFIDSISQSRRNKQIVGPIISAAKNLGVKIVAEGVEDIDQLNYLKNQECHYIQGFLLSKPVGYEKIIVLIEEELDNILNE